MVCGGRGTLTDIIAGSYGSMSSTKEASDHLRRVRAFCLSSLVWLIQKGGREHFAGIDLLSPERLDIL